MDVSLCVSNVLFQALVPRNVSDLSGCSQRVQLHIDGSQIFEGATFVRLL
jgi:hypothetical protein